VPLSDHEQKLLAQMEQALYAEDPKFATSMTGRRRGGRSTTRLAVGVAGLVLGLLGLVLAIVLFPGGSPLQIVVAVGGFVLMFAGAVFAVTGGSGRPALGVVGADGRTRPGRTAKPRARSSFFQRMEQRWERRRDNGWM
jgi:hypothetical protein